NPEDPESVKQNTVLQYLIDNEVSALGRKLVDDGITVTPENCNWTKAVESRYEALQESGASGATFPNELLGELAEKFGAYMVALGKPAQGVEIMQRMMKARFNEMATRKYVDGLDLV